MKPAKNVGPSLEILPAIGSDRTPCKERCQSKWCEGCRYWWDFHEKECCRCGQKMGPDLSWCYIWPNGEIAHQICNENFSKVEQIFWRMDSVIESASKKMRIPASNFVALPNYVRGSKCEAALDELFPEWREKVKEKLTRIQRGEDPIPT